MKRSFISHLGSLVTPLASAVALVTISLLVGACSKDPAVNRVGVNVVDKQLFSGSWYYSRVVIDVDYEAAGVGTYPGDAAIDFIDPGVFNTSMPRIRWVIDEDTLFAYRDYEIIEGINPEGEATAGETLTHPVAAFSIESHFDIRRGYSTLTGEEQNVIQENTTDRRWYERDYMRVDWSKNMLPSYYGQVANLYEVIGFYNREPSDLYIQGQSDFPDSWRPTFDFMQCQGLDDTSEACTREERDFAEDYEPGEFYHFSFVTQELLSPGNIPDPFTGRPVNWCASIYSDAPTCTTTAIYIRNAFLKVSDTREYEPVNWLDSRFNRAGYFRNERRTFDRSTGADDPSWGSTDFLNYNANRQNIWRDWVEEDGSPTPYAERRTRQVVWYTTTEMPAHLIEPAFDLTSRWNEVYMRMVRNLRGEPDAVFPPVSCQSADPEGYCYCHTDPETGETLNPTCAGQYDPFETPEQAAARGVSNPYQCHVQVPEGAQPDMNNPALSDRDFYGWYGADFVGDECINVLRVNACNRAAVEANGDTKDGLNCQERGDLRLKFMSYVDQPGTGFLGVATMRTDPISGEIIAGDSNIGGPALDGYRTFALQTYDIVNGDIRREDFLIGEDVRDFIENLGNVQPPAIPREEFAPRPDPTGAGFLDRTEFLNRMDAFVQRGQQLAGPEGRANIFSDRLNTLRGTDIERRLMENHDTLAMAGIDILPDGRGPADINDDILDRVSPFRVSPMERLQYQNDVERRIGEASVYMPNEFTDNSVMEYVIRHRDWPRARLEFELNQTLMYQTELHEMGHCMGLRHSFKASTDNRNYDDNYYYIAENLPLPQPAEYDTDGINGLNPTEQAAWEDAYHAMKERRELAGIERWMDSSIMEYTAQWYERTAAGTGRYDDMAINYAYGDLVEVYDNAGGLNLDEINPINTDRLWVKSYHGGESCNVDADCPYSTSGANSALLLSSNSTVGLTQTCRPDTRGAAFGNICSNIDADMQALVTGPAPRYAPVVYKFCTDDRVGTDSECHRFDEGDSYREIVRNVAEQYDRQYLFTNFRRYRSSFSLGGYLFNRLIGRQFNILQSMFQDLLYRYTQDPEYRDSTGPFGFDDHFLSTADTLNFYGRIMSQPGLGAYRYDAGWDRYELTSVDPESTGAQLSLPLGMARYQFSEYQNGISGISRIELIGSFYEKWFTMQMLTQRGWTTSFARDVPFWTNFYDLFPVEMQQIFTGMILGEPEAIAPRVICGSGTAPDCGEPRLVYPDFYRGDCSTPATCRPSVEERFGDELVVSAGSNVTLSFLATVFSLSDFPVFFDTTFQNQLFVCIEGNGACFEPNAGDIRYEPGVTDIEDADYATFFSERYGKSFIAWQIEPSENVPNQRSIGFEMVRDAEETQFLLLALQTYRGDFGGDSESRDNLDADTLDRLDEVGYTIPASTSFLDEEINRLDGHLRRRESFFFQLIQLENQLGVRSYLRF